MNATPLDNFSKTADGYVDLSVADAAALVAPLHHGVFLIDVREPEEFNGELGHVEGAELISAGSLASAASDWDRERVMVLVCRSGRRSGIAAKSLASMGFAHVANLAGGMIAWNEYRKELGK